MRDGRARDLRGSPDRFGYEWHTYAEVLPIYEEQFRRWTPHLSPEDWRGASFLDVGCGMGRNSVWPMRYGAVGGVAADIDERSLASAKRNLAQYPTVAVERCSAYDLAWQDRFDIVFSIGVIHHLEFPDRALSRMVQAARPGGPSAHLGLWTGKQRVAAAATRSATEGGFQQAAGRIDAPFVDLSHGPTLAPAEDRRAAERLFQADLPFRLRPSQIHCLRSNATAHRALLAAGGGRRADAPRWPGQ
jgi:SAM-dependent methyltransferase